MATYYVSQSGAGSANGTSEANAWSAASFNTAGNWSATPGTSGKISPGDTVTLVGTISTALTVQGSGASGNVITILFGPGAKISAPFWATNTGAIMGTTKHYITIDGGATGTIGGVNGDPSGANGIIEATDNGTALTYQQAGNAIRFQQSNHLTVTGLVCQNLFVRTANDSDVSQQSPIVTNEGSVANYTDFTVTNCILSHGHKGIQSDFGNGSPTNARYTFTDNTITNINWGISSGARGTTAVLDGVIIARNRIYEFRTWEDPADIYHHNGIYLYGVTGNSYPTNIEIYGNIIGPYWGAHSTGAVFIPASNTLTAEIYNNVFLDDAATGVPSNGHLVLSPGDGSVLRIYNNTMIGEGGNALNPSGLRSSFFSGTPDAFDTYIYNNIVVGKRFIFGNYGLVPTGVDNNLLFDNPEGQTYTLSSDGQAGTTYTFAQWQALGYDANGIYGEDPLLDAEYKLQSGSPAIGAGENLSTHFTTDADGIARASQPGAWDLGAYAAQLAGPAGTKFGGTRVISSPSVLIS